MTLTEATPIQTESGPPPAPVRLRVLYAVGLAVLAGAVTLIAWLLITGSSTQTGATTRVSATAPQQAMPAGEAAYSYAPNIDPLAAQAQRRNPTEHGIDGRQS